MYKPYIITTENTPESIIGSANVEEIFARELHTQHQYLSCIEKAVKAEVGNSEINAVKMAVINFALSKKLHLSKFFIEPTTPQNYQPIGFSKFDYHNIYGQPSAADNDKSPAEILLPKLCIDERVVNPLLASDKFHKILDGYHFIASFNHDFGENLVAPKVFNGYESEFNVQPCEHFISTLHSKAMRIMLAEDEVLRNQIITTIAETILFLDELKNSKLDNADAIASTWIDKLMSAALYFIPLYEHVNTKAETSYGFHSIDDALKAYGLNYEVTREQIEQFNKSLFIISEKRVESGGLVLELPTSDGTAKLYANKYALAADKRFRSVIDVNEDADITGNYQGFAAFCACLLFKADKAYDYSHLFVHDYDKVAMIESESALNIFEEYLSDLVDGKLLSHDTDEYERTGKWTKNSGTLTSIVADCYYKALPEVPLFISHIFGNAPARIKAVEAAVRNINEDGDVLRSLKLITSSHSFRIAQEHEQRESLKRLK